MCRTRYGIVCASLACLAGPMDCATTAGAANAITKAIEKANPCQGLKMRKFGITVGIDTFKAAALGNLKLEVNGDDATASIAGSLSCRTSDGAAVKGDASASFTATAAVNLASCAVSESAVQITSTGGTFGFAIDAMKGDIEAAVARSLSEHLQMLCR